ncbi:hypothetical protein ACA910_010034 [Epithemia clementina (nom. ined.)]
MTTTTPRRKLRVSVATNCSAMDASCRRRIQCAAGYLLVGLLATCMNLPADAFSLTTLPFRQGSGSLPSSRISGPVGHGTPTLFATPMVQEERSTEKEEEVTFRSNEQIGAQLRFGQDPVFELLAGRAAVCLLESDLRGNHAVGGSPELGGVEPSSSSSSATNWINDASAFALQNALDQLRLKLPEERVGLDRDVASSWWRWIKAVPIPTLIDFSSEFRPLVAAALSDQSYALVDQRPDEFLNRVTCRMILLPSGASLPRPLSEVPASIIFGKLLYGGVTRSRLLGSSSSNGPSSPRPAGERQEIKTKASENIPVWMMYGGPDRMYQSADIGSAAVLEVVLLPRGQTLDGSLDGFMVIDGFAWKPNDMFDYVSDDKDEPVDDDDDKNNNRNAAKRAHNSAHGDSPLSLSGHERNEAFRSGFQSSVGGLQPQIDAIVRRVLDGRVIRPADDSDDYGRRRRSSVNGGDAASFNDDKISHELAWNALEAEELALIGLTPVRGLLLYGPPGCGKTALAREISTALRARAPKIVSAPELLDRWVGGSEKLVRALFADAEAELAACNGDATKSALHVIVIDEIDAVFRKRTSAEDSGESTRSSVVNQILTKLDGVNSIPNVLLIGMTNRRELLDDALLRPGRLEVQIEIPLPDERGRREILQIHFRALRERGRLSKPLCCAIDGVPLDKESDDSKTMVSSPSSLSSSSNDELSETSEQLTTSSGSKRSALKMSLRHLAQSLVSVVATAKSRNARTNNNFYDLAADYATGGFSGADIAGLVRCAGSIALARSRKAGSGIESLMITLDDVILALEEVKC